MGRKPLSAIIGLGLSEISRQDIGSAADLAIQSVNSALHDAGLALGDVDGLLLGHSPSAPYADLPLRLRNELGLEELTLLGSVEGEGTTAVQMVQQATLAVGAGLAQTIVCVFADAPLKPSAPTGSAAFRRVMSLTGLPGWEDRYGLFGAAGAHALSARRYMYCYGAREEHFGAYVLSNRRWAERNPGAALRSPLTFEDYFASPYVAEPFRVLDCAYPVNGAVAVIVTSDSRSVDSPRAPVFVHGMGQGHLGQSGIGDGSYGTSTGGTVAARGAYRMASVGPKDVNLCQFYDAFSYLGILALEDYGLCRPGEGAEFVRAGTTAPGGALPVNTGGGHLSGYYLQGMTPLAEAVLQARGQCGERQVERRDIQLVTGVGGCLDYHAALILSPLRMLS